MKREVSLEEVINILTKYKEKQITCKQTSNKKSLIFGLCNFMCNKNILTIVNMLGDDFVIDLKNTYHLYIDEWVNIRKREKGIFIIFVHNQEISLDTSYIHITL